MSKIILDFLSKITNAIAGHMAHAIAGFFFTVISAGLLFVLPKSNKPANNKPIFNLPVINVDINTDDYYVYEDKYTYEYRGGGERELDSLRSDALMHVIKDKVVGGPEMAARWFCDDDIKGLLASYDNIYSALLKKENPLNTYFLLKYHEENIENNKYSYRVVLLVPKERYLRYPMVVSKPLRESLNGLFIEKINVLNDFDSIEIVLNNIKLKINNIELSIDDQKELAVILKFAPDRIKRFIDGLISGKNDFVIDNFSSGKYRIEGSMEALLVAFVENFLKYRPKGYQYNFYCVGYADERLLKSYEQYVGGADFILGEERDMLFMKGENINKSHLIKNNNELSVARAYESAKIINNYISDKEQESGVASVVDIYYRGGGVKKAIDPDCNRENKYDCARQIRLRIVKMR